MQKYESANMRVSASTLYRLAKALGVEPNDFFRGYAGPIAFRASEQPRRMLAPIAPLFRGLERDAERILDLGG